MDTTVGASRVDAEGLFRKYWPMVLRRCQQLLCDDEEAFDAAQEVFVKILEKQGALHGSYPSSLLWRMATNHCLNVIRDRTNQPEEVCGDTLLERIAYAEDIEERLASRDVLRALFGRHPESSRTIAVLHLVDGMTLEETAQEVGMSMSGVRRRLRELKKTLTKLEGI